MEWQPIETAPTSRRLLLCAEVGGKRVVFTGGYDSHWSGQCWVADARQVPSGFKPTHWMPLPDPPPRRCN
jgi:hypothetical protein